MTIYHAKNSIDAYRMRALSGAVYELSGRPVQSVTNAISSHICEKLSLCESDVLVDIGCGDGSLLIAAQKSGVNPWVGRLVGILPSREEVEKLTQYLIECSLIQGACIVQGLSNTTSLSDQFANKVVSNGVFLLLDNEAMVDQSLIEMHRITKPGGLIFIGELPERNEVNVPVTEASLNDKLMTRVYKVFKRYGLLEICRRFRNRIKAVFSKKVVIIQPKAPFWMSPGDFSAKLEYSGFQVLEIYQCKSYTPEDANGVTHRYNYIARRK
jgi:ubiquinone/menaquinone biosynthesis C-methylase UbiE